MRTMYVYDTLLGRWMRESLAPGKYTTTGEGLSFEGFTCMGGVLFGYANDSEYDPDDGWEYNARIWAISNADRLPSVGYIDELDSALTWFLETGDFNQGDLSVKTVDRLFIRAEKGATPISVSVSYDGGATYEDVFIAGQIGGSLPWAQSSALKSQYELPIFPRRADNYRIRLEGGTGARLYGIGRSWHTGSHTWTRKPS